MEDKDILILNKIMDQGVIVNKTINTDNANINLVIYKGLVEADAAYALLKMTNNSKDNVVVRSIVKEGFPIKDELLVGESTYIIVEEQKIENKHKIEVSKHAKKNNIGELVKSSNFGAMTEKVEKIFNIYFIDKENKVIQIPKFRLREYFNTVVSFDYYKYIEFDIQKGLYKGVFVNGYETLKNNKITPKTYYFIIDNLSGEVSYLYILNKKVKYKQLKNLVKGE
jgi:hypothetical protein